MAEDILNNISKFYKSFSGTDTLVFIMLPDSKPIVLGSITTISYSMYRNKKPVLNIGRVNINGVTRGSRIYAGTVVFTLINQHWFEDVKNQIPWLKMFDEIKVDELPLFDLMVVCANEYGNAVTMYMYGVDFTDEGQVVSVQDLFTENTFSFVCRDIVTFRAWSLSSKNGESSSDTYGQNVISSVSNYLAPYDMTEDDFNELMGTSESGEEPISGEKRKEYARIARMLYNSTSNLIFGSDVIAVQTAISKIPGYSDIEINGVYDSTMEDTVKELQSKLGDEVINGIVDQKLYQKIQDMIGKGLDLFRPTGIVVNKNGAYVYEEPDIAGGVVDFESYKQEIPLYGTFKKDDELEYYITDKGYIRTQDVYSYYYDSPTTEMPILKKGDDNYYVTMIQNMLSKIFKKTVAFNGFTDELALLVGRFQRESGLQESGIVDEATWLAMQAASGGIKTTKESFVKLGWNTPPGRYTITKDTDKNKFNITLMNVVSDVTAKTCAIVKYKNTDKVNILSKSETFKAGESEISVKDYQSAFVYNPKYGEPTSIEYFVYIPNEHCYKWILDIGEGGMTYGSV